MTFRSIVLLGASLLLSPNTCIATETVAAVGTAEVAPVAAVGTAEVERVGTAEVAPVGTAEVAPVGTAEVAPVAAVAPAELVLPANTVVELEIVEPVGSKTSKPGEMFHLRVVTAVVLEGSVLIAAGTPAVGQVIHATKSGTGGKAGELILAARYLDLPHGQVKLRSSFGAAGKNRVGASAGMVAVVGVLGMLVRGRDVELPAGSPLSARLAIDTIFPQARPEPASAAL